MANNFFRPGEQGGHLPPRAASERPSFGTQHPPRAPSYPYPLGTRTPHPRNTPHPPQSDLGRVSQQYNKFPPPSGLQDQQTPNTIQAPIHIMDDSHEGSSEPPRKKAKGDNPPSMSSTRRSPKPQTAAKPAAPAHPVIDLIPNGPPGDMFIKVSVPTTSSPEPTNTNSPKKTVLIRVHSLLLRLHSTFFRDLLCSDVIRSHGTLKVYSEASPWTLPADWDSSAFLDWCVMVCGAANISSGGVEVDKSASSGSNTNGNKQQQRQPSGQAVKVEDDGAGDRQGKKLLKGVEAGKISRFPRIVALAEKLGCTAAMRQHCGMPLWKFFGPNGEADEEGLKAKGLDVVDAVAIAYVVDDETLFRRASEYALVSLGKDQWDQEIRGGLASIIPSTLFASIKTKRRATLSALEKAAYKSVTAIHDKVTSLEPCNPATEKLATYTLQMCHVKNGAYNLAASDLSLADVWDGLEGAVEALPETTRKCKKDCEGGCAVDMREILIKAIEESKECVEGLCLRCVKERVVANEDGVVVCEHDSED